jgi:hypothetical protein
MGGGLYSAVTRASRADDLGYSTKSINEIFQQKSINSAMNPHGVSIRESRDSNEHPNSLAVVLALDVTGSMGSVPHHLVKEGLPNIMDGIIKNGIKDPQLLFLAVGDHECDSFPFQVGQFESSDELLDKWLTDTYLEGGGGGNAGESYLLAWYFAGHKTSIDCFEKRKQKGYLFTIGDEPTLKQVPKKSMSGIFGDGQYDNFTADELLEKARETYNVYHLHVKQTNAGGRIETMNGWKQLMGDGLIIVDRREDIPSIITKIVTGSQPSVVEKIDNNKQEIIL